MTRHKLALALGFILVLPVSSVAAPLKACLKTETGKVIIKRRCKAAKGQQTIDAEVLQGLGATQVGPEGPQGPQGPAGPQGDPGPDGITGHEFLEKSNTANMNPGDTKSVFEFCPSGLSVVNYLCSSTGFIINIQNPSGISRDGNSVQCTFRNDSGSIPQNVTITVKMVCGPVE